MIDISGEEWQIIVIVFQQKVIFTAYKENLFAYILLIGRDAELVIN
jgi:hypothetical protein